LLDSHAPNALIGYPERRCELSFDKEFSFGNLLTHFPQMTLVKGKFTNVLQKSYFFLAPPQPACYGFQ